MRCLGDAKHEGISIESNDVSSSGKKIVTFEDTWYNICHRLLLSKIFTLLLVIQNACKAC